MIGFGGPLLVRLEARTAEVLSLDVEPKPLLLNSLEARVGIEPTHKGFADLSLTTWVPRPWTGNTTSGGMDEASPVMRALSEIGSELTGAGDGT